jgi:Tfp pilus assembly protein PilN
MAEKSTIELIPKEVEAARGRDILLRRLRLYGFGFFAFSILASGGLFAFSWVTSTKLDNLKQESAQQVAQIAQFADIEKKILGLADKSAAFTKVLSQRDYFSIVLAAIETSRPANLNVNGSAMERDKTLITITGETASYVNLAAFLQNLTDPDKGGALFEGAALTSVNLNASKGTAEFVIEATIHKDGLKKPLIEEGTQ